MMRRISRCIAEHGPSLVLEKTECVILTKGRVPTILPFQVGETMILSVPTVNYLGMMIESKMSFLEQIRLSMEECLAFPHTKVETIIQSEDK